MHRIFFRWFMLGSGMGFGSRWKGAYVLLLYNFIFQSKWFRLNLSDGLAWLCCKVGINTQWLQTITVCFLITKEVGVLGLGLGWVHAAPVSLSSRARCGSPAVLGNGFPEGKETGALGGSLRRLRGQSPMALPGAQSCRQGGCSGVRAEKEVGLVSAGSCFYHRWCVMRDSHWNTDCSSFQILFILFTMLALRR